MRISTPEFIALMAMLVATVALSIDAMLPALPNIALELTPNHTNQAQLILSSFILGMALGTFVMGPLSDSFGRKNIIYFGASVYIISSALCMFAPNLETIVVARVLQGIGAAAPRVVSQALIRDLYLGREMARISSFIMIIFSLVPAVAPLLGAGLISVFDWRAIFVTFILFVVMSTIWTGIRITEPLKPEMRVPFNVHRGWPCEAAFRNHRIALYSDFETLSPTRNLPPRRFWAQACPLFAFFFRIPILPMPAVLHMRHLSVF